MTRKKFFTHPATLIIGSILIIVGVLAIGKKYWGWFPDDTDKTANGNINSGGRLISLPDVPIGLIDVSATERTAMFNPSTPPISGYILCYARVATFNKGNESLAEWQDMVTNTLQSIRNNVAKAQGMGYKIAITIHAPKILPGEKVSFFVYAENCDSQIAKEVINYISNLH